MRGYIPFFGFKADRGGIWLDMGVFNGGVYRG